MPESPLDLPIRPRRLRRTENLRRLVRESRLSRDQLMCPLFISAELKTRRPIPSMPGVDQLALGDLAAEAADVAALGIPAVLLFGLPPKAAKDAHGTCASDSSGIVQRAIGVIKTAAPDLVVVTDLCFCEYTSHGHCGPLNAAGDVLNDATVALLCRQALSHAEAGADVIAPSGMMDGAIGALREALDAEGHTGVVLMSYAAKFASAFYGPFRDAADSAPAFGDRRAYQMDPANGEEALREVELDLDEGADIVMVKPAGPCLDVIRRVKDEFQVPLAAYQVSGEYAMLKAAAQSGWLDHDRAMMESLLAIRRAGADILITYFAKAAARLLA